MTALERTITAVAARCLRSGVTIEGDTPFDVLGLDSLATIELAAALETELGCELPADLLAECSTARALAARLQRDGLTTRERDPFEQMFADAVLADDVRPVAGVHTNADLRTARTILLTGATGFLGGMLLNELLSNTAATVVCLVRSSRLKPTAAVVEAGFSRPDRVQLIAGDLSHPRLGLSAARFDDLARSVDAIVHAGAAVNWVYSYAGLRAANVNGTLELLRLACRGGAAFHFVSSLSVCYSTEAGPVADESFAPLDSLRGVHLGYAQTKVVGEALVRAAGMRGLPVRIYRPALISGHSVTGAYNRDDLIATLVRGCVRMGTAPDLDWRLDAVPVDYVARAIVDLSRRPGTTFHLAHEHPRHWRECVLWMRMYGYDVRLVSYPAWLRQLECDTKSALDHPLRPLRSFFLDRPTGAGGLTLPELYEDRRCARASSVTTGAFLEQSGVTCPALDASLLDAYFAAFRAGGDLPDPAPASLPPERRHDVDLPVDILSSGSEHSIVSELTAWRSQRRIGLFRANVALADGSTREAVLKIKARDCDLVAVGEAVADLVDAAVGRAYRRWSARVGFAASHAREIAIYRQQDPRFVRHVPAVLRTVADEENGTWAVLLERVTDATLIDSADRPDQWQPRHLAAAIDGLAELQSIWFGRERELREQPWIGHVQTTQSMAEMSDLWRALADHAAPLFCRWSDPAVRGIHRRLVGCLEQWWQPLEAGPRTLIHNDFNPRNICLRGPNGVLCAYDWELATVGAPQRDLAEFLCFVLPHDATVHDVRRWLEHHRHALGRATRSTIDARRWEAGFRGALYDFLVNRLAIYAMVHRIRRQSFLPHVVRTWRHLYGMFPLEETA